MQSVLLVPGQRCRPFVIGDGRDASFPIDPALMDGAKAWTLVEADGTVCVPPHARSSIAGERLALGRGENVVISFESLRFEIRAVGPPGSLRLPLEINWKAFSWSSAGVLMSGLAVVVLIALWPRMPAGVRERVDALEARILSLAGDVDEMLARIDPFPSLAPDRSVASEPELPCQPVTTIEVGSSSAAVAGGGAGSGNGPYRQQAGANGIDWSSVGPAGEGQEAGSLLGYGMCMLPGAVDARTGRP